MDPNRKSHSYPKYLSTPYRIVSVYGSKLNLIDDKTKLSRAVPIRRAKRYIPPPESSGSSTTKTSPATTTQGTKTVILSTDSSQPTITHPAVSRATIPRTVSLSADSPERSRRASPAGSEAEQAKRAKVTEWLNQTVASTSRHAADTSSSYGSALSMSSSGTTASQDKASVGTPTAASPPATPFASPLTSPITSTPYVSPVADDEPDDDSGSSSPGSTEGNEPSRSPSPAPVRRSTRVRKAPVRYEP